MDLFSYPTTPGYRKRETSKEAASQVKNVSELHEKIWFMLSEKGALTDYELADAIGIEFRKVQPRRSELAAQGKLIDSGTRRKTPYGRNAICWQCAWLTPSELPIR